MRFNPFNKAIDELCGADLAVLRDVSEGWFIEYKSALINNRAIAKSLSAFANHYGGWLFFGVKENAERKAGEFPGLDVTEISNAEEQIRNASRDCVSPSVFYEHKVIPGPVDDIGLAEGRCLIAVHVPMSLDTPHVHNEGRIYRRIADASEPVPETDRAVLDMFWKRGDEMRDQLLKQITKHPTLSKGENDRGVSFLHLYISADPFELRSNVSPMSFSQFSEIMRSGDAPFDNCFANAHGQSVHVN